MIDEIDEIDGRTFWLAIYLVSVPVLAFSERQTVSPEAYTSSKLASFVDSGFPISIGRHTYGGPRLHWSKGDFTHHLTIGAFCSIADDVSIFVGRHGRHAVDFVTTYPMAMEFGPARNRVPSRYFSGSMSVTIGNDVWIGRGATILAGVTIGDGAIIATRAVINKDVEPYTIVGGVPAKFIRRRFDQETTDRLIRLQWWNWDDDTISARMDFFSTPMFEELLNKYLEGNNEV